MERSSFFNAVLDQGGNPDRAYLAEDFAKYFSSFIGNGVFPNPANQLQVVAVDNNMQVRLKQGMAWINGYFYTNTDDLILKIEPADGVLSRIDRVVLRLDFLNREIKAKIKKGSFASTPVAPTLQRDADAYEIAVSDVSLRNGVIKINQSDIMDTRLNKNVCGIVHGIIEQVDTTEIFRQYQAWFLENKKLHENDFEVWMKEFKTVVGKKFTDWVDDIKNSLDPNEDIAAQLQMQISANKSSLDDKQPKADLNLKTKDKTVIGSINELNSNKVNNTDFDNYKKDYVVNNGFGTTSGSGSYYYLTLSPAPSAYADGMQVTVIPHVDSGTNPKLNVNSLGYGNLLNQDGSPAELKKDIPYSFVRVGNNFFIRSGLNNSKSKNFPKWYEVKSAWVEAESMPEVQTNADCVAIGDKIYIIGGRYGYGEPLTTNQCYDSLNNTWSKKNSMIQKREGLTCSAVDNKIYAIGGRLDTRTMLNVVECYDVTTDSWRSKTSMPTKRQELGSSTVGNKIYAIGGVISDGNEYVGTVECYDVTTDSWTTKASMPTKRQGLTCSIVDNKIYAIGGYGFDKVECYDTENDTWTTKTSMPTCRNQHASSVISKDIYVVSGTSNGINTNIGGTMICYNTITDSWSNKPNMLFGGAELVSASIKNNIYASSGGNNKNFQCYIV